MEVNIEESFRRSIRNGTGESILILKDNPNQDFDQTINDACMRNLAYDPQCEGTRSEYLLEIISLSKNKAQIIENIISRLQVSKNDDWDTLQLLELTKNLALTGNEKAKLSLYERYKNNLNPKYDFVETEALVDIDGFKGLCFSMEVIGQYLGINPDFWVDDFLLSHFKECFPQTNIEKELQEMANKNQYIKAYLDCEDIQKWLGNCTSNPKTREIKNYSYKEVSELIRTGKRFPITVGKRMNLEDIAKLVKDFERNESKQLNEPYLRAFIYTAYPGNIKHIISFLYSDNETEVHFAVSVLSQIKSNSIRIVIENSSVNFLKNKVRLLVENYLDIDMNILLNIAEIIKDEDDIHCFVSDVIKVFENHKIEKPSRLINKLYGINNCSLCRESMVEILISSDDISKDILSELFFDSDLDIRQQAKDYRDKHSVAL
jgi:hypothetical protein